MNKEPSPVTCSLNADCRLAFVLYDCAELVFILDPSVALLQQPAPTATHARTHERMNEGADYAPVLDYFCGSCRYDQQLIHGKRQT